MVFKMHLPIINLLLIVRRFAPPKVYLFKGATGKFTGKSDFESTIYKVNKEATIEIAKQLRLHDIGGIVVIDYIDMHIPENNEKIESLLKEELKKDRAKTQVEGFTKLNLMELTRKHICSHLNEV